MTLLKREAVVEAGLDLYVTAVNDVWDEQGRWRPREWGPFRAQVLGDGRPNDATILEIMWRRIGRAEQAWGFDVGLVFHHMGIPSDDVAGQARALYYLMMGIMGHGVSLWDDYADRLDQAAGILREWGDDEGKPFDASPFDDEMDDLRELAETRYPSDRCDECGERIADDADTAGVTPDGRILCRDCSAD